MIEAKFDSIDHIIKFENKDFTSDTSCKPKIDHGQSVVIINNKEKVIQQQTGSRLTRKIYPFTAGSEQYNSLDKKIGCRLLVSSPCCLKVLDDSGQTVGLSIPAVVQERISRLFTEGYWSFAKYRDSTGHEFMGGNCYMLSNYLKFGVVDYSRHGHSYTKYYQGKVHEGFKVLDVGISDFDESKLKPGDLLQMFSMYGEYHGMLYLGHGTYINCHGKSDIYFQNFEAVIEEYYLTPKKIKIIQ